MYESMYELAERARFELADALASTVFKTVPPAQGILPPRSEAEGRTPRLTPNSMYESMYAGLSA